MEYRCGEDGKTWHCCAKCPNWPKESFNIVRLERLPTGFVLCEKCMALMDCSDSQHRTSKGGMKLGDCPGVLNWPPEWTCMSVVCGDQPRYELSILEEVRRSITTRHECHLIIQCERRRYMGTLRFDSHATRRKVSAFLTRHGGKTIARLGELNVDEPGV